MAEFREKKRRRIEVLPAVNAAATPKPAPTSAPGFHEIATFLPGRLEFEHELDNDAEELIKDLEFGLVYQYGGDEMPEDDNDLDIQAKRQYESRSLQIANGLGHPHSKSASVEPEFKEEPEESSLYSPNANGTSCTAGSEKKEEEKESPHVPLPIETEDSIAFKLTLLEMYANRVEKRHDAKSFIFDRGLLEYRKVWHLLVCSNTHIYLT
jgi:transcriptional adapter 2-alpha